MDKAPAAATKACNCEKENLTTEEAADFLRMSPRSLETMRSDGTGPSYCKLGRGPKAKVIYRPSDLRKWRDIGAVTPQRKVEVEARIFSKNPLDYTREELEKALLIAARLVAAGSPTWPFEMIEDALALHKENDARTRALELHAQKKSEAVDVNPADVSRS